MRRALLSSQALTLAAALALCATGLNAQQSSPSTAAASPTATTTVETAAAPPTARRSAGPSPAAVNLVFAEAHRGLAGKAEAIRALKDVGAYAEASSKATDLAAEWQRQTNEWREKALTASDRLSRGQGVTTTDADRAVNLYALGEAETQRAYQSLSDLLALAGRHTEEDQLALDRLEGLNRKAQVVALADVLRQQVRDAENRVLALAGARAQEGNTDGAVSLLTRLHAATASDSQRQAVLERLYAVYCDTISAGNFRTASRLASWYARNGDRTVHTWQQETLRLVRLMLDPEPRCGGPLSVGGKGVVDDGLSAPEILCRFFIDAGAAPPGVYVLMGRSHQATGECGRALEWYQRAARELDHDATLCLRMAECHASLGQIEEAVRQSVAAANLGTPIRQLLEDPELACLRETPCYLALAEGSLF